MKTKNENFFQNFKPKINLNHNIYNNNDAAIIFIVTYINMVLNFT